MGRPLRITYPGAHYHVTSRGNEQKDIYKSRRDREQFLSYLESSVTRYGANIHVKVYGALHIFTFEGKMFQLSCRHGRGGKPAAPVTLIVVGSAIQFFSCYVT